MNDIQVKVWDPLVRVFHWSLVISVAAAWLIAESWRTAHEWFGYMVLLLIAVRVAWGFAGGRYARFRQFLRGPAVVANYARQLAAGNAPRYIGHNPLGAWMMATLLLTLLTIGVSGWMLTLDAFFGSDAVTALHETLANALLFLVALHVAGAIWTGWKHGENLVRAMVTGTKRHPGPDDKT